jgi:hypothetical protein
MWLPLALWLATSSPAHADRRLDLAAARPFPPLAELVVSGENHDAVPRAVTIRVDDHPGADYADRVNEERVMPPGPFTVRLRLALLRTPRHRPLDLAAVFRAIAFAPDGGDVTFAAPRLDTPPALPAGVHGWFLGPAGAVPLRGFEPVAPGDPRISGPHLEQIARPGGDPVLAFGVRLTRFETRLPPGRWRVTLWTEDPGEWETLPPVLQQRIRVNGTDLVDFNRDYPTWIAQRYLAGRAREADPAAPPFAAIGAFRGGRVAGEVTVGADGALVVELAGFPQAATHLSALTAEPADRPPLAAAAVEALRAARFAEAWPVLAPPPASPHARHLAITTPPMAVTAPGGVAILRASVVAPAPEDAEATVRWDGPALPADLLWGQWRWRRPGANVAGLIFSAGQLRGDSRTIPLRPDLPRPLVLIVRVPAATPPGIHRARLRLRGATETTEASLAVDVLPVSRPASAARVGPFLGFAPQLLGTPEWSKDAARRDARAQAACDLATLAGLGLTAVTAPLTTPDDSLPDFIADMRATLARFPPPVIAYETLRTLGRTEPPADAAAHLARAAAALRAAGVPEPIWSVADEPAYSGTTASVQALAEAVHAADPAARLAGHLNDRRDFTLLPRLALVTVNPAAGVDRADIDSLREAGVSPWLYNMPHPRLAAGAYLWRSGADGLLQWHARMPTADAFDPTDGREGDVQFLWPTPGVCGPPDLDADLLDLVEGEEDLRWLAWLDAAAAAHPEAARLRHELLAAIPATWTAAAALPADRPAAWRDLIANLAAKLR